MNLQKVWMSPATGRKNHYAQRTLGSIVGIAALMLLLICGGTLLSYYLHWPREIFSVLLCFGATALAVWLALRVGWRSVRDATVFFLTEDDRLYAMDARTLSDHGHGIPGYIAGTAETQKFLRTIAARPFVPAGADEVLKVERIRENRSYYAIICQVRHPNRQMVRRTYFLVKGSEDEDLLLYQLERRQSWENRLELAENRNPRYLLISTLTLAGLIALCVLSHPEVGQLPQGIYFPCLGAAFVAVFFVVYFVIRLRRGE